MKITLDIPVDDIGFICSASLKGWLRNDGSDHTFMQVTTDREKDALVRLMDSVVLELGNQTVFHVPTRDEFLERAR